MAKNDIILVDGIVDQRILDGIPSKQRDEAFEFLVLGELLKDYDLSSDELKFGWTDGGGDGGLDGFYIFINGSLLDDVEDFVWPRSNASIELWLVTCKHHSTFAQAPLDALIATISELFNFEIENGDLIGTYSSDLIDSRDLFIKAYRRLSIGRPTINIHVVYGSRGDSMKVGAEVLARAKQIESIFNEFFSSSTVGFRFFGAAEIVESQRREKAFSLSLPFIEHLATGKESYVLLVRLGDFWKFVSDESGNLRRYLFDSNVRDFLGPNAVNGDIARSLADPDAPDFWWLNNGVTILATNATIPGKTIQVQDIQIVNGLQTTETVFRHFKSGSTVSEDRALLVKIVVTTDMAARDRIIRATNNQTSVEIAALHATDKIQRDIEEVLAQHEWYYERRKNYYRNVGKPQERFVIPTYLASAVVALAFKNAPKATRIRPRFMRDQTAYDDVFSVAFPIELWPVLVGVYKVVDGYLASLLANQVGRGKLLNNLRPIVSLLVVGKALGSFSYSVTQLSNLDVKKIAESDVAEALEASESVGIQFFKGRKLRADVVTDVCKTYGDKQGITGLEQIGRRTFREGGAESSKILSNATSKVDLTPELIEQVDSLLPIQPWKPGVNREVADLLGVTSATVSAAIQLLIADGRRNNQRDGVVYDAEGNVLATDPDRVCDI